MVGAQDGRRPNNRALAVVLDFATWPATKNSYGAHGRGLCSYGLYRYGLYIAVVGAQDVCKQCSGPTGCSPRFATWPSTKTPVRVYRVNVVLFFSQSCLRGVVLPSGR